MLLTKSVISVVTGYIAKVIRVVIYIEDIRVSEV